MRLEIKRTDKKVDELSYPFFLMLLSEAVTVCSYLTTAVTRRFVSVAIENGLEVISPPLFTTKL